MNSHRRRGEASVHILFYLTATERSFSTLRARLTRQVLFFPNILFYALSKRTWSPPMGQKASSSSTTRAQIASARTHAGEPAEIPKLRIVTEDQRCGLKVNETMVIAGM